MVAVKASREVAIHAIDNTGFGRRWPKGIAISNAHSGATVLIRPDGTIVYSGGITPSRGHEEDNFGVDSILKAIERPTQGIFEGSVYGCSIVQDLPEGVE